MSTSPAQPTLDQLREQEERLVLPSLSENDAVAIGMALLAKAIERDLPVTIEVRRASRVVFRAARTGTNGHNDMFVAGKARIVERFGHSTLLERRRYEERGTTFAEATSLPFPEYAPHGGGFPLMVRGTGPIGVAIVSGLAQEDDHALIVETLEEHLAARNTKG